MRTGRKRAVGQLAVALIDHRIAGPDPLGDLFVDAAQLVGIAGRIILAARRRRQPAQVAALDLFFGSQPQRVDRQAQPLARTRSPIRAWRSG